MLIPVFRLAMRDLTARSLRCFLTVSGIAIAVGTYVAVEGLVSGFERALTNNASQTDVQLEVTEKEPIDFLSSLIPESVADRIAAVPGVAAVAPILVRLSPLSDGRTIPIVGWPDDAFLWKTINVVDGRIPRSNQPVEALIGARLASSIGVRIGDVVQILGVGVKAVGIAETIDRINRSSIFLRLPDLQAITHRSGQVTSVGVKLAATALGNIPEIQKTLSLRVQGFDVVSTESLSRDNFLMVLTRSFSRVMAVIAISLVSFGVLNTISTSVTERRHEFAIMRAVGWPVRRIALFVMFQSNAISVAGVGLGLALGYAGARGLGDLSAYSAYLEPQFEPQMLLWGICVCFAVSTLGALIPLWTISRMDPATVLRSP